MLGNNQNFIGSFGHYFLDSKFCKWKNLLLIHKLTKDRVNKPTGKLKKESCLFASRNQCWKWTYLWRHLKLLVANPMYPKRYRRKWYTISWIRLVGLIPRGKTVSSNFELTRMPMEFYTKCRLTKLCLFVCLTIKFWDTYNSSVLHFKNCFESS